MITGSAIIVTLFLGGWHFPGIPDGSHGWIFGLINIAVFFAKVAALIFMFMWVRWTLPRSNTWTRAHFGLSRTSRSAAQG